LKSRFSRAIFALALLLALTTALVPLSDVKAATGPEPEGGAAPIVAGSGGQFQFAKYLSIYKKSTVDQRAAWQWLPGDFTNLHNNLRQQGFYLVNQQRYTEGGGEILDGVWDKGNVTQVVKWARNAAQMQNDWNTLVPQGYRLRHISASTRSTGVVFETIYDLNYTAQQWVTGWTLNDFIWKDNQMRAAGYGLIHVQAYHVGGNQMRYLGIWNFGAPIPAYVLGYTEADYVQARIANEKIGWFPVTLQAYDILNNAPSLKDRLRYDALFLPNNNGRTSLDVGVPTHFSTYYELFNQNFRLVGQNRAQYVIQQPSSAVPSVIVTEESRPLSGSSEQR
jgi:Bacterial tandem repeat domain 1